MDPSALEQLRAELARYPRRSGYYLVRSVPLPAGWESDEETALTAAFEALDDQPWPPPEQRPTDQLWTDYEVEEDEARGRAIAALVGGPAIGHTRDTIPAREAVRLWTRFRALFGARARFFRGVGLGDREYPLMSDVLVVDDTQAGCFCVIESD